jgi:ketosteroid isomerase-like protein
MKKTTFATPQDAEAAFYEALERADLDAMMEVWSDDDEVACIHPGGARLSGFGQVRESWAQMFKSGQRLQVQLTNQVVVSGMMFSIHSLHENILAKSGAPVGTSGARSIVVTTNIYVRAGSGWRMVMHHASPAAAVGGGGPPADTPKVLH